MSLLNTCGPCLTGSHTTCANLILDFEVCECTHTSTSVDYAAPTSTIGAALVSDTGSSLSGSGEEETGVSHKRRLKDESSLKDQQSTGRKRAAALFPLKDENGKPLPCEFANKAQVLPGYMEVNIDGCGVRQGTATGIAQARHHMSYDVLDNSSENVVRICHSCHNTLHSKNDPYKDKIYERIYGFKPKKEDLSYAAKALKSGVVSGGKIKSKEELKNG